MTVTENDCRAMLKGWTRQYMGEGATEPCFMGFSDLGKTTRGTTRHCITDGGTRYGMIRINTRLKASWRIKATLWHEFCHHWEWAETGVHGHGEGFDSRVRRNPVQWLLCAISRCIPMR